jgi:AcrR family transcriptional regulator
MSAPQRRRTDSPKAPLRMRKAERKRQLLAHAKRLFVTLGYQNTTTDKIARAANVSEPVLYRHFESKKALFIEVLNEIRQATLDRWNAETALLTDPLAKMHGICDMYVGTARDRSLELRVVHRTLLEADDEEIASCLRSLYLDHESFLAKIIQEGQQTGVFRRSLDPRVGAWELIRTGLGYTLTVGLRIPLYEEPDYLARAIECTLHCLIKDDV